MSIMCLVRTQEQLPYRAPRSYRTRRADVEERVKSGIIDALNFAEEQKVHAIDPAEAARRNLECLAVEATSSANIHRLTHAHFSRRERGAWGWC